LKKVLLALTTATVFLTGYGMVSSLNQITASMGWVEEILWSVAYTALFLSALALHEYGHIISSRKSHVVIEGPFFIPAPPIQLGFIGTFGAVITMKSIPPDRRSLAELGLAGPLAGFLAGLVIGLLGLYLSPTIPVDYAAQLVEEGRVSVIDFMPAALIVLMMTRPVPPGQTLLIHPIMYAAYIIFLVTFINLMPIGQLDGGHVVRSYLTAKTHEKIGYLTPMLLISSGLILLGARYVSLGFFLLLAGLFTFIFKLTLAGKPHPGPANQFSELKDYRYLVVYLVLLALTMPIPAV